MSQTRSYLSALSVLLLVACSSTQQPDLQATIAAAVESTQVASSVDNTPAVALSNTPSVQRTNTPLNTESPRASVTPTPAVNGILLGYKNRWLGYPTYAFIGNENSAREGYRAARMLFYQQNISEELIPAGGAGWGKLSLVVEVVDSLGFEYKCISQSAVLASGGAVVQFPPLFAEQYWVRCEVPNNATGLLTRFKAWADLSVVLEVPLPSEENAAGSGAGDIAYQMYYADAPSIAKISQDFPNIGSTATIENFAEVTLASAVYNTDSFSWAIELQVKNLYGYDLSLHTGQIQFEIISDAGIFVPTSLAALSSKDPVIPPGSEGVWEFAIQGYNANDILIAVFDGGLGGIKGLDKSVYTAHRLQRP